MKSAYELALEKSGGALDSVSEDKKKKIAEMEAKYKSKIAEAEISAEQRIRKAAGDLSAVQQIKDDLAVETASFRDKCEKEKEKIRNGA